MTDTVVIITPVVNTVAVPSAQPVAVVREELVQIVTVGVQGPAGPSGVGSAPRYEHVQASPASSWTANHNLGFKPQVQPLSVGGVAMLAEVVHASVNQAVIYFDAPVAGVAVLN